MPFYIDTWYLLADSCSFKIDTLVYVYWKDLLNTLKIQQQLYWQAIHIFRNWVRSMLLEPVED